MAYVRSLGAGAHPRSRGENGKAAAAYSHTAGSSPLTRGKPGRCQLRDRGIGLIPAHAGKTGVEMIVGMSAPAHPRSRGENLADLVHQVSHLGSSPLTRGKQGPLPDSVGGLRLIPAHAGKTRR